MRKMILALILAIAAPVWATITLVHTASGNGNTLTISSTTAGNSVLLLVPFSTSPSTVVVGSQSAVKHPTCGYADGDGLYICLWYVASATGGQTSVTLTGAVNASILEYEFSGTNTSSLIDNAVTDVEESDLTLPITPSQTNEAIVTGVVCINSVNTSNLTASPTALSNMSALFAVFVGGEAILSSTSTETASTNGCGDNTTTDSAAGAIWSINPAGGATNSGFPGFIRAALDEKIWRMEYPWRREWV